FLCPESRRGKRLLLTRIWTLGCRANEYRFHWNWQGTTMWYTGFDGVQCCIACAWIAKASSWVETETAFAEHTRAFVAGGLGRVPLTCKLCVELRLVCQDRREWDG